ncbi:heat shock protein Hsp33 [Chloropicon primus]|uniref:Heat shock protein Hsp33 n=2 Tax=Chloropicon primus TaxID=1764295 RepID=A0A5B8MJI4_9CHLO|nr:heat shock protein Hsp33 [Chloropicon primus]UPQ99453.1 heat shock protein Hsp33 [Chloropicon primus]|eukprot:QDZ20244.1 heat shock protein Hsp33 [Chloropicon primus]
MAVAGTRARGLARRPGTRPGTRPGPRRGNANNTRKDGRKATTALAWGRGRCWRKEARGRGKEGVVRATAEAEAEVFHYLGQDFVLWVVDATGLVERARKLHNTTSTATQALGRVLMGTLLIGESKETSDSVQITFKGNGPLGQIMAIAEKGFVKGRLDVRRVEGDLTEGGSHSVGKAVGRQGVVTVVRKSKALQQYTGEQQMGITELVNGEVAEDLTNYLAESEQINSAMGLGLVVSSDLSVRKAGGYLLQMLPGAAEETLDKLEENIKAMPPVSELMSDGKTQEDVASLISRDLGLVDLVFRKDHSYGPCNTADLRERMVNTLKLLSVTEVRDILREQNKVEMCCEFCAERIQFSEEDLVHEGVLGGR